MRLGVIADTRHHLDGDGRPATIEAVAAQVEQLAAMFDELVLLVPLWPGPPPPGYRTYRAANVSIAPVRPAGGSSLAAKARLAACLPAWSVGISRLLRRVDAVHLRAPCNIALLGIVATRLSRCHRAAMFAGNWDGYPGEPLTYRAQRSLLGRPSFGGPVTVYTGRRPDAAHVVPFFSPSFTLDDWEAESAVVEAKLAALAGARRLPGPVRLVTVGHLDANKNQSAVVDAVRLLLDKGIDARLHVVGDGPMSGDVVRRRDALGLQGAVQVRGRLPLPAVRERYREADINVLASRTEGYPKVVVEGMVGGAVPVTSDFPASRSMLGDGRRGLTVPFDDPAALAGAIAGLVQAPDRMRRMIEEGRAYARTVTLDDFGRRLAEMLEGHWGASLRDGDRRAATSAPPA